MKSFLQLFPYPYKYETTKHIKPNFYKKLLKNIHNCTSDFTNELYKNLNISIKGDENNCNQIMITVPRNSEAYEAFERIANRKKECGKFEVILDKGGCFMCIYPAK